MSTTQQTAAPPTHQQKSGGGNSSSAANASSSSKSISPEETIVKLQKTVQQVLESIEQMSDQVTQVRSSVKHMFEVIRNHVDSPSSTTASSTNVSSTTSTGSSTAANAQEAFLTFKLFTHAKEASQALHHLSHTYIQNQSLLDNLLATANQPLHSKSSMQKLLTSIASSDDMLTEYEQIPHPYETENSERGRKRPAPTFMKMSENSSSRQSKRQKLKKKNNEVLFVRAIISQQKWSSIIHDDPMKLHNFIYVLNKPLSQLSPPARTILRYHSLMGLPMKQDANLRLLHLSIGEGLFHAFVTVVGKDLNPIRVQIFGMDEHMTGPSDPTCTTFDDEKRKIQREVEQHSHLHPQERSKHHVFNMISRCCEEAIKFYQTNKDTSDAQLQCMLLYLACYEKVFMEKCVVCGKLLHLDSEAAGFVPPMRSFLSARPIHVQCASDLME